MTDEMPTTLEAALAEITQLRADIEYLQEQNTDYEDGCYYADPHPEASSASLSASSRYPWRGSRTNCQGRRRGFSAAGF